ncbi:MAG: hypothetical protein KDD06_00310 [Phaeodactylibacter sp.]|nr:hypothetical protein [Phaeodactylibacter sp.]MCB9264806.1 hypothetical protein [Lewinellaceae bacterium]MCB9286368.1 hypothetical protein [Lewinellaceae bacterium]
MRKFALLLLAGIFCSQLSSQPAAEVASCLRACLQAPEMEAAFTQEWGELRPLYLRKREAPGIGNRPIDKAFDQLNASDFLGLPWEVRPVTEEEIKQLPAEEARFGILEASVGFREDRATANLFVHLPQYPRKWLSGSFLLENQDGQWSIIQRSVEIRP